MALPAGDTLRQCPLLQRRGLALKAVIPRPEAQKGSKDEKKDPGSGDSSQVPSTSAGTPVESPSPSPFSIRRQAGSGGQEFGYGSAASSMSPGMRPSLLERRKQQREERGARKLTLTLDTALAERENAATNPFLAGTQSEFSHNFDVLETLGQGSTGVVYRAKRKDNQQDVALKVMRMRDEEMLEMAREEFNILRTVVHHNIILAHDFYSYKQGTVLVMDYFAGETLDTSVLDVPEKRFSEFTSKQLFKGLIQGLKHLHELGIIHRDIKPQNMLVSKDLSEIRLIDFNTAKKVAEGALTMTGTPDYMPPEVLLGESHSESCDVWSSGLCLGFMLAGTLPCERQNYSSHRAFGQAVKAVTNGWMQEKLPHVSGACLEAVQRCLAVNPSERSSAAQLLGHEWMAA